MKENALELYNQGYYYYTGTNDFPLNHKKAIEYFIKAAELGETNAMNYLGVFYENGRGVSKDMKKAAEWYYKAFKANPNNPYPAYNLGRFYYSGEGVPKNVDKAYQLFNRVVEYGKSEDNTVYTQSCYYKGVIAMNEYYKYLEAGQCFLDVIRYENMPEAYHNLGFLLQKGHITMKKKQGSSALNALEYYEKAALLGYAPSMNCVAGIYSTILKDNRTARMWLNKAIELGYEPAKTTLKLLNMSESGSVFDLFR